MTQQELEERDLADIRAIFQTREGARFFSRLVHSCGLYRMSIDVGDCANAYVTTYNEGIRNVGLKVLKLLLEVDENAVAKIFEADRERKVTE